jgi:hypothetical protein
MKVGYFPMPLKPDCFATFMKTILSALEMPTDPVVEISNALPFKC